MDTFEQLLDEVFTDIYRMLINSSPPPDATPIDTDPASKVIEGTLDHTMAPPSPNVPARVEPIAAPPPVHTQMQQSGPSLRPRPASEAPTGAKRQGRGGGTYWWMD
ncbi:hypothetical protein CONPUDRAFT_160543 [Coniophora puteana RWD-64-598 SS2]|uniref:Uncharacterized protein n=1 Tax=Coniophora puteana (strain RWD-64-598) TaxID=741705 RepID=R7SFS7_CONPW|nr:uncharacterized protein CONPUDRAFT_160543 [Coniophora puteana RWD-64-598 SS2]EIW73944.1 hypothetical protein CONPUDRAFT_160543 [Coniophora puteana RWD-64-598 SS2]